MDISLKVRKSNLQDCDTIMAMIEHGRANFKIRHIDQWQNGYPNTETILSDIENGEGYIVESGDDAVASFMLLIGREPTYDFIYDGAWKSEGPYAVVHRIVMAPQHLGKGYGKPVFALIETLCLEAGIHSIKIDTHELNIIMNRLLRSCGYEYCGKVDVPDGKRVAYEKQI